MPLNKRYNGVLFQRWARKQFFAIKEYSPYPDKGVLRRTSKILKRAEDVINRAPAQQNQTNAPTVLIDDGEHVVIPIEGQQAGSEEVSVEKIQFGMDEMTKYLLSRGSGGGSAFRADADNTRF